MVTVRHELDPGVGDSTLPISPYPVPLYDRVPNPRKLSTSCEGHPTAKCSTVRRSRRLRCPGSAGEADAPVPLAPEVPFAVSYAIGRFGWPPIECC